jgi:hypothetical protein
MTKVSAFCGRYKGFFLYTNISITFLECNFTEFCHNIIKFSLFYIFHMLMTKKNYKKRLLIFSTNVLSCFVIYIIKGIVICIIFCKV